MNTMMVYYYYYFILAVSWPVWNVTDSLFPRDMDDLTSRVQELPSKVMTSVGGVMDRCSIQWCRLNRFLFTTDDVYARFAW